MYRLSHNVQSFQTDGRTDRQTDMPIDDPTACLDHIAEARILHNVSLTIIISCASELIDNR